MPKIPRDLSGRDLAHLLGEIGYEITRQTGSHLRLTKTIKDQPHHITIPDHDSLKIGTLNQIIKDIAQHLNIEKKSLVTELFKQKKES
ncbi:MAG: type II toxin-antitoxin system HicA family toxin [Nitrospira sp.]|nr:type II toxin-antitoxin system HicA family toxin [Nitrospira sp.]